MPFTLAYAHSEYIANGPNISDKDRRFYRTEIRPNESDRRSIYDNSLDFRLSPTQDLDGRMFLSVSDMSSDLDNAGLDADRDKDTRTYNYGTVWNMRLLDGRLENKDSVSGMNTSKRLIYYNQNPREA